MVDKKLVLVIEEYDALAALWRRKLAHLPLDIHHVEDVVQARSWLASHDVTGCALIVMDGKVRDGDTLQLTRDIRASGYQGPMLATSALYGSDQLGAGCTRHVHKDAVPSAMRELLGMSHDCYLMDEPSARRRAEQASARLHGQFEQPTDSEMDARLHIEEILEEFEMALPSVETFGWSDIKHNPGKGPTFVFQFFVCPEG